MNFVGEKGGQIRIEETVGAGEIVGKLVERITAKVQK